MACETLRQAAVDAQSALDQAITDRQETTAALTAATEADLTAQQILDDRLQAAREAAAAYYKCVEEENAA